MTLRTSVSRRAVSLILAVAVCVPTAAAASTKKRTGKRASRAAVPIDLVWHVENHEGTEVTSIRGDLPINPASVVKVATTLWALEKLGPSYRFHTGFAARGTVDASRGVLAGDLVISGGGDPDFHVENAFLVAARLNQLGIRQVKGALRVDDRFWIGWEGGSERTLADPTARTLQMGQRLRAALDPSRWTAGTRASWRAFAARYSLPVSAPPRVAVLGGVKADPGIGAGDHVLLTHRSKGLVETLRRFDCYSNNDIERLGASLGTPAELAQLVTERTGAAPGSVQLQTISGLGTNRMTSRLVVRLLKALRETCDRLGVSVESLLPVAGCDPGTLNHSFARLGSGPNAMSVVAKTGTLTSTDGGTAVLAGFVNTARGDLAFCVAAPRAGGRLTHARRAQARWVEELIAKFDGARPRQCAAPLESSERGAEILVAGTPASSEGHRASR